MRLSLWTASSVVVIGSLVGAQVQPGDAIASMFGNLPPMEGLLMVNRNGTCTPVTGAAVMGIANMNAVALDPMDGRIWTGGTSTSSGQVHHLRILNNIVFPPSVTLVTTLPSAAHAIAFDVDCNPVVGAGLAAGPGGLFRVHRTTGQVTNLIAGSGLAGEVTAVEQDLLTGDLYFGLYAGPNGPIYKLTAPGYAQPATLVGTVAPPSSSNGLWGITFVLRSGVNPDRIFWTTASGNNTGVGFLPAAGGLATLSNPAPALQFMNWIEYDLVNGDLWLVTSGAGLDQVHTMTQAGASTFVCAFPNGGNNGTPSAIDVNDNIPGSLRVCPQYLPSPAAPITLELSLAWRPGDLGVIVITKPIVQFLGLGVIDQAGLFPMALPGIVLPPGNPGVIEFQAASIDPTNFTLRGLSGAVRWPRN